MMKKYYLYLYHLQHRLSHSYLSVYLKGPDLVEDFVVADPAFDDFAPFSFSCHFRDYFSSRCYLQFFSVKRYGIIIGSWILF